MAAESSNTGFFSEHTLNRHAISFQSAAMNNSASEMFPMGNYFGLNASTAGMILSGNSSMVGNSSGLVQAVNNSSSSSTSLLDSIPALGLKHDTGLAVEWSLEDQYKLDEGLVRYADESNIMKYVKIAATLGDKTVRDVALRCRWMTGKRRRPEEHNFGKKLNNRKDKLVELNSKMNIPFASPQNMGVYPLMMHHMDQNGPTSFEVPGVSGTSRHLLEQNAQAFSQITSNLSTFKLRENIELFCRTRNNIMAILNDMREMPGIMSQMPTLPVSINEDLANSILPNTTQVTTQSMMLSSPMGIQLKQEPRC